MDAPRVYPATVLRWVDGDTVILLVDLGFYVRQQVTVRLDGIDTPERGQAGYQEARLFAEQLAKPGELVTLISTMKDTEKWGRWMGRVLAGAGIDVSDHLLGHGLAVEYHGGTKPPRG